MKIGDFAKLCNTKISVLQHYDKIGLLHPIYIDRFTNYRYYDPSQIVVFERIRQLKTVGFTLSEIKEILYIGTQTGKLFEKKNYELEQQLEKLNQLKNMMIRGITMTQDYKPFIEESNLPFENDEQIIGKWLILGETTDSTISVPSFGDKKHYLYFLPNGEQYWCYGWTKGKLLVENGRDRFYNDYRTERRGDDLYMIIDYKSIDYPQTKEITSIALRKIDDRRYSKEELARKDDINKPFVNDKEIIGRWKSCGFLTSTAEKDGIFEPVDTQSNSFYFKEITFSEGGHCTSLYGDEWITGDEMQTWTKGYVLRKWNSTACAYEIKHKDHKDYLIMEWKSGDYRWGGYETDYYVFLKEA